jgi:hypothetical protein
VKPRPRLMLDARRAEGIAQEVMDRRAGYLPDWQPPRRGPGAALNWAFARYLEAILQRLNQAPEKNRLAFLDLLGVDLIPPQAARAPLVFRLSATASDTTAAAGTQVAAPPPPESSQRLIFETEQQVGLSAGKLSQVVSLWAGRDQYVDHSADLSAGRPFKAFEKRSLKDTPHHIYLAHDTLLAIAGQARIKLEWELLQPSSERLDIAWEYWDGKVWRGFRYQHPECLGQNVEAPDSTLGLRQTGRVLLTGDCITAEQTTVNGQSAYWIRGVLQEPLPPDPDQVLPLVDSLRISTEIVRLDPALLDSAAQAALQNRTPVSAADQILQGLAQAGAQAAEPVSWVEPEQALFAGQPLDTSQTFYPFGMAPKPSDTFYVASEEILSKPGAEVCVAITLADTPAAKFNVTNGSNQTTQISPDVIWEYWDGTRWRGLGVRALTAAGEAPEAFRSGGVFSFQVPDDVEKTVVEGQEGWWIRAGLAAGGYGFTAEVSWSDGAHGTNTYTYFVNQAPAVQTFRMGYVWQHGPFHAEKVLAYNDFQYTDYTEEAIWPGRSFSPFSHMADLTPALYLGFTQKLPVDRLNLFFDIAEDLQETEGPALMWEYWDGFDWSALTVQDETNDLRLPGMLSLIGPEDAAPLARFDTALYWLRGRMREDGPPGEPTLNAIYPNAVWAAQRQTVVDEPLGASTGRPDQAFMFRQIPVLEGERIEVRELSGPRANVEWRILALEVLGDDYRFIQDVEDELSQEGTQAPVVRGDLRLMRDRRKRVTEVWVRWYPRRRLYGSGPADRHYAIERSRGRVVFGDGLHGRVPPAGAVLMIRSYQTGGGRAGNVAAGRISQQLGAIGGLEAVSNPLPSEGGADAESLEAVAQRGPQTLRCRGRCLAPGDYETMAHEASPAVAVARALPGVDPSGVERPGWVTLIITPHSEDERPWPSFGLREQVRTYIAAHAPADLVKLERINVTGPQYREVDVKCSLSVADPTQAGTVEKAARQALERFLHPLWGGPVGMGWEPGRAVFLSDAAAILERVPGVDFVAELVLAIDGAPQGECARMPAGHTAVAGQIRIKIEA